MIDQPVHSHSLDIDESNKSLLIYKMHWFLLISCDKLKSESLKKRYHFELINDFINKERFI